MSAFLFGQCGCCRGGLTSEGQSAVSLAPYWMGWVHLAEDGALKSNPLYLEFSTHFSEVIYLTLTKVITIPGSGTATLLNIYDRNGKFTSATDPGYDDLLALLSGYTGTSVSGDGLSSVENFANGTVTTTLSDPYTYEECVQKALGLLDQIDLLNPDRIYTIAPYGQSYYSGGPIHFCYPSEAGIYLGQRTTSILYVGVDLSGNPVFSIDGSASSATGVMNGFISSSWHTYGGSVSEVYMDPNVMAAKSATRSPVGYQQRNDSLVDLSVGKFVDQPPVPITIAAGENIFYPSDVPGYGASSWSVTPPPGLPTS